MEVYSPKAQKPDNFKKNTMRKQSGEVMINSKPTMIGRTVVFELDKESPKSNAPKNNLMNAMFDYLKLKFYNRMRVFFDYEDRFKEGSKTAIK